MKYATFISLLKSISNPIDLLLADLELFRRWSWRWKIRFTLKDVQITLDQNYVCTLHNSGNLRWYQHGKYHREGDKPAVIYSNGIQMWYKNGRQHRDHDGPAVYWGFRYSNLVSTW